MAAPVRPDLASVIVGAFVDYDLRVSLTGATPDQIKITHNQFAAEVFGSGRFLRPGDPDNGLSWSREVNTTDFANLGHWRVRNHTYVQRDSNGDGVNERFEGNANLLMKDELFLYNASDRAVSFLLNVSASLSLALVPPPPTDRAPKSRAAVIGGVQLRLGEGVRSPSIYNLAADPGGLGVYGGLFDNIVGFGTLDQIEAGLLEIALDPNQQVRIDVGGRSFQVLGVPLPPSALLLGSVFALTGAAGALRRRKAAPA